MKIRVVVLDQRMPLRNGTDLFLRLRAVNPGVRGIVFSGEAETGEVSEAYDVGYAKYLHKSEVERLPEIIREQWLKRSSSKPNRTPAAATRSSSGARGGTASSAPEWRPL
ncbi:response regulator [Actinoplanes sp. CA-030573]|uniref:response regulator n=1 Tax=Actinoplanes sp. CA-030573 TaxID=3239898 RepID=UPI003D8B0B91